MDAAGAVCQSSGDVDDPGTDRGGAGDGVAGSGQVSGGAVEVVRDGGAGQPGVVGGESARGQVRQRPVDQVRVDLLDDGVATVLGFGLLIPVLLWRSLSLVASEEEEAEE